MKSLHRSVHITIVENTHNSVATPEFSSCLGDRSRDSHYVISCENPQDVGGSTRRSATRNPNDSIRRDFNLQERKIKLDKWKSLQHINFLSSSISRRLFK